MHFFTEPSKLINLQGSTEKYGPVDGFLDSKYRVTSKFDIGSGNNAKVYACQSAMMLVIPSVDLGKVNLVLQPTGNLKLPGVAVKYFIYRGISKSQFISGSDVLPQSASNPPSTSEFIDRFWDDFEDFKIQTNQPLFPNPLPEAFGFDTTLTGSEFLEDIFNGEYGPTEPVYVKQGEELGEYTEKLGFEIVLQNDQLILDYNYGKKTEHVIEITGSMSSLEKKSEREKILEYIDPGAFWGSHYSVGLDYSEGAHISKSTVTISENDIYVNLLDNKYSTKNMIYIDIRSEYGYSYNYYENYGDPSDNLLKIKGNGAAAFIDDLYYTHSWPIFLTQSPAIPIGTESISKFKLKLRIDDNLHPLFYYQNQLLFGEPVGPQVINEVDLLDGGLTDWSKEVEFYFPNTGPLGNKINVSYYFKLFYFRKENNTSSPSKVFQNSDFNDNVFGPIELNSFISSSSNFQKIENNRPLLVYGSIGYDDFTYIGESGVICDNNKVLFYVKKSFGIKDSASIANLIDPLDVNVLDFTGFKGNVEVGLRSIQDSGNTIKVPIVSGFANYPTTEYTNNEDYLFLGITKTELQQLDDMVGFDPSHKKMLVLEENLGNPLTELGDTYYKFELKCSGWNSTGDYITSAPTGIFVYKYHDLSVGICYGSKDFGNTVSTPTLNYKRNQEEHEGEVLHMGIAWEDFFIDKHTALKNEVDSFISDLNLIGNNSSAPSLIKNLIDLRAPQLFGLTVTKIQSEMSEPIATAEPDDRPLYWARIKVGVAIKSHPHFQNSLHLKLQSGTEMPLRVVKASQLGALITRFEEKSRNYIDVDFSGSTADFNLLVTGFDPFQLYNRIMQSNPSGPCAMGLHGRTIACGSKTVFVQTMMLPVRWEDFDSSTQKDQGVGYGIVEKYIGPLVGRGLNKPDIIITISQSSNGAFHIDRLATIHRGGGRDNMHFTRAPLITNQSHSVPYGRKRRKFIFFWEKHFANYWYQTQLPKAMVQVYDPNPLNPIQNQSDDWGHYTTYPQHYDVLDPTLTLITENITSDTKVWDTNIDSIYGPVKNLRPQFPDQAMRHTDLTTPLKSDYIYDGPGGNYLSNELFYRVSRLREEWELNNPTEDKYATGHFHVSAIHLYNSDLNSPYNTTIGGYPPIRYSGRTVFDEQYRLVKTVENSIVQGLANYNSVSDLFHHLDL